MLRSLSPSRGIHIASGAMAAEQQPTSVRDCSRRQQSSPFKFQPSSLPLPFSLSLSLSLSLAHFMLYGLCVKYGWLAGSPALRHFSCWQQSSMSVGANFPLVAFSRKTPQTILFRKCCCMRRGCFGRSILPARLLGRRVYSNYWD
jgi:hypothetical protein